MKYNRTIWFLFSKKQFLIHSNIVLCMHTVLQNTFRQVRGRKQALCLSGNSLFMSARATQAANGVCAAPPKRVYYESQKP